MSSHPITVLVTGGAGFIGSNLVDALVARNLHTIVVDDFSTGFRENLNPKAELLEADLRTVDWNSFFTSRPVDAIFHLAAQMDVRKSVADPMFDFDVNMTGPVRMLNAAAKNGVKRFIFSSSGGAGYGSIPGDALPVSESRPPVPESPYGAAKMAFDLFLSATAATTPLKYVSLRFGNVYGPRQNPWGEAGVVAIFTEKMESAGEPVIFGDGSMTRDYVYVGDIVDGLLLALQAGDNEWINLGLGLEISVDEVFDTVKAACGSTIARKYAPPRPGEVHRIALANDKAKAVLGWSPKVAFAEGVGEYVKWYRARRALGPLSERK